MIDKILAFFGFGSGTYNSAPDPQRKYVRHASGFHAEVIVGDRIYSVRDWSLGGIAFETGADARIQAGDKVQVTMKFHFPHDTITIEQPARIVRTAKRGAAAEFAPLKPATHRLFKRVQDSFYAQNFLESQTA
jgi:hypothetical protein